MTASDSGIGRATAVALAETGLNIGITWHSDEAGARDGCAGQRSRVKAEVAHLDTSALDSCGDVIDELADRLGGELGQYQITANCVAPGEIATPMTGQQDQDRLDQIPQPERPRPVARPVP